MVATAFVAAGALFLRLVIDEPSGLGNAFLFGQGVISCLGAAVGAFAKRPHIGISIGLLIGPAVAVLALIYAAAGLVFDY